MRISNCPGRWMTCVRGWGEHSIGLEDEAAEEVIFGLSDWERSSCREREERGSWRREAGG